MMMHNAQERRYLREIQESLPCTGKVKRGITRKINGMIDDAMLDESDLTYEMLVKRFGTPQQIASSYVDEMDTPELLRKLRIKKKVFAVVCATAAIILAIWIGVVVTATQAHYNSMNSFGVETITITERITDNGGE